MRPPKGRDDACAKSGPSFDRQADAGYIESIAGKDLEIAKTAEGFEVGFAYERKIPLFGPASLLIDYVAGSGATAGNKAEQ